MKSEIPLEGQKAYYDNYYSPVGYVNRLQLQRLNFILKALEEINYDKPIRILDFGCGTGWLTSILNSLGHAVGIDLSEKAIDRAKSSFPWATFICGDLFSHPFEEEYFDLIVSQEVIEHVNDQMRYLELAARYLKRDGYLILTTPNAFNLDRWEESRRDALRAQPIENCLTRKELKKLLSSCFDICSIQTLILGYGSKGVLRIVNSCKLNKCVKFLKLNKIFDYILLKLGCGLHMSVVARRK